MGRFLDGQENATCDKISFSKQAPTSINNQLLGQSQRGPKKTCVSKMYQNQSRKSNIKGILICESTKRKYLSVAIVNECK
jgi:hypothetical protein